jgi:hypothetical protein
LISSDVALNLFPVYAMPEAQLSLSLFLWPRPGCKKKTVNLEVKPLPCHTETIEYNKLLGLDVLDLDGSIRVEGQN